MNIPLLIGLVMARANAVAGANNPPAGPPTDVSREYYSGVKIRVKWKTGDITAASRIYNGVTYLAQVAAGVLSYETGLTSGSFGVSHYKAGQETEIVSEIA